MATRHDVDPKALAKARRKAAKSRRRGTGVTRRVRVAIEALVWDGAPTLKAAAEAAGLTDRALRAALRKGPVLAAYRAELAMLRDGERAQNLRALVGIRDDDRLKDTAAGQTARIKAIQVLEGEQDGSNPGVNVNIGIQTVPGYCIDLREPDEAKLEAIMVQAGSTHRRPFPSEEGHDRGKVIDGDAEEV